jgi:hypothetical protein
MPKVEIYNARIEKADIVISDHGILTDDVVFACNSFHQGLGGYRLRDLMGQFIENMLHVTGKSKWSDVKGSHVRIESTDSMISGVGHIIEEKWFRPKDLFK